MAHYFNGQSLFDVPPQPLQIPPCQKCIEQEMLDLAAPQNPKILKVVDMDDMFGGALFHVEKTKDQEI